MKKRMALMLSLAMSLGVLSVFAAGQAMTQVRGNCKDDNGKPIVGATVELMNVDTNRKVTVKTDKHGDYLTMGVTMGNYKVTLYDSDGKVMWVFNNRQLSADPDSNVIDFDLAKERAAAAHAQGLSPEEQKKMQETQAQTSKIKSINDLLTKAGEALKATPPNWELALTFLQQAADQDQGQHDLVYGRLADALSQLNKLPEAEAAYTKAISLAPTKGEYYNNLGQVYLKENKVNEAIAQYNKAAEVDPAHAGIYYFNLGAVLINKGRGDEALVAMDKAIAADPTKAEAYYQKGLILIGKATYGSDGKVVPAPGTIEALNKYLELAPTGPHAEDAKALLGSLGGTVQTQFGTDKHTGSKPPPKR